MWTKTKFLQGAVVALLLLNVGGLVFFRLHHPPHRNGDALKHRVTEMLQLDAAQVARYEQLIEQHRTAIRAKESALRAARQQLYALLEGSDTAQKDTLALRIGALQTEIEYIHFDHFLALKSICRPEQQPGFRQVSAEMLRFFNPRSLPPVPGQ